MALRTGSSLSVTAGLLAGLLGGLCAGVMVSAGAAPSDPPSGYEIVRATFSSGDETAEGTARCSDGTFVFGGGGRVLGEGVPGYTLVASDPTGPSGWTAAFVRTERPEESPPLLPGGQQAEEEQPEIEFEVTAVCAPMR